MPKKKKTIEDLAILVQKGFDQIVTKDEFRKETGDLKGQIARLSVDMSRLKEEMRRDDPFVEDLLRRMRVVEKRVGVTK